MLVRSSNRPPASDLNLETAFKRGSGSPENDVTRSSANEGKMVANKGSFCLLIRPTIMLVLRYG